MKKSSEPEPESPRKRPAVLSWRLPAATLLLAIFVFNPPGALDPLSAPISTAWAGITLEVIAMTFWISIRRKKALTPGDCFFLRLGPFISYALLFLVIRIGTHLG